MDHSRKAALQVRSLMIHMNEHKPNPTQAEKILKVLQDAKGEYVNGRYFIQTMMVSQAHTRIFELQKRGYRIEASDFKDEFGFKSYRLIDRELPESMQNSANLCKHESSKIIPDLPRWICADCREDLSFKKLEYVSQSERLDI